jgi:hypothetical protein
MADALAAMRARRAARRTAEVTPLRSCAGCDLCGCDLCCTAPGIKELHKPPGEPCRHLAGPAGRSCSVYASRPKVCIDFHCLWRVTERVLPEWLRPADCGFLLAFNRVDVWPAVVTVHPDPQRPDAWRNKWAMTVFATIAERWNCLVAIRQNPDTSDIFCPNGTRICLDGLPPEQRVLLVREDGTVGAPGSMFGPDRRPLIERLRDVQFVWRLPQPPADLWDAEPLHDREHADHEGEQRDRPPQPCEGRREGDIVDDRSDGPDDHEHHEREQ